MQVSLQQAGLLFAIFFCYVANFFLESHTRNMVQELNTFESILKTLLSASASDLGSV